MHRGGKASTFLTYVAGWKPCRASQPVLVAKSVNMEDFFECQANKSRVWLLSRPFHPHTVSCAKATKEFLSKQLLRQWPRLKNGPLWATWLVWRTWLTSHGNSGDAGNILKAKGNGPTHPFSKGYLFHWSESVKMGSVSPPTHSISFEWFFFISLFVLLPSMGKPPYLWCSYHLYMS